jgi:ACS family tartrate transporter-like MFS transporter
MDAMQKRVLSKAAYRLVPILTLAYLLNYLDRTNISFAALTMNRQIGLSATQFGYGAGIFFISYCAFEIPSNLALYRFGARRWIARIMITWGIASAATALIVGPNSFYIARFVLGIAEAGFFPGVTFYLATWFPAEYRARMLSWFLVAIPVSSVLGGPISGGLMELDGSLGLAGWQWLFIVSGLPSVIVGIAILYVLTDRPQDAAWLAPAERSLLVQMLAAEPRDRAKSAALPAIKDARVLVLALIQFGFTLGSYGLGIWLPQAIKGYGLTNLTVTLIGTIPYVFASLAMVIWAWGVDRSGKKIVNLTVTCLLGAIGMVIFGMTGSLIASLIGAIVALVGVTSARAIFWTIPTRFLVGSGAAGGLAFINSVGLLGGFAGPSMMGWLKDATGSFLVGSLAMAAILAVAALLSISLKLVIKQE